VTNTLFSHKHFESDFRWIKCVTLLAKYYGNLNVI
jgi:hypothetical protein